MASLRKLLIKTRNQLRFLSISAISAENTSKDPIWQIGKKCYEELSRGFKKSIVAIETRTKKLPKSQVLMAYQLASCTF